MEFKANFGLPFTLLADPDHEAAKAYGVWGERMVGGTLKWSTERSTFVIDADGAVAKILREVDPEAHASDVLAALGSS